MRDEREFLNRETTGHSGTAAAPATQTTETSKLQVATDDNGAVKIGTWRTLPSGYTPIQTKDEIVDALLNFNATELRERIASICVGEV